MLTMLIVRDYEKFIDWFPKAFLFYYIDVDSVICNITVWFSIILILL